MLDKLPTLLLVVFIALPLFMAALGIPLMLRKVRPNVLYGYRTRATLSDPTLWYEVNARTGADLLGTGLVLTAMGAIIAATNGYGRLCGVTLWLGTLLASGPFMIAHGLLIIRDHNRKHSEAPTAS